MGVANGYRIDRRRHATEWRNAVYKAHYSTMNHDDNVFTYRHERFVNYSDFDKSDRELVRKATDAIDIPALEDSIEETFLEELGAHNYNNYFRGYGRGSPEMVYSHYEEDGGEYAMHNLFDIARNKNRLASYCRIHTPYSQAEAQELHHIAIERKNVQSVKSLIDEGSLIYPCSACAGHPWPIYLALHKTGNFVRGEPIPEAAKLFDKYKERHVMECNGCSD